MNETEDIMSIKGISTNRSAESYAAQLQQAAATQSAGPASTRSEGSTPRRAATDQVDSYTLADNKSAVGSASRGAQQARDKFQSDGNSTGLTNPFAKAVKAVGDAT